MSHGHSHGGAPCGGHGHGSSHAPLISASLLSQLLSKGGPLHLATGQASENATEGAPVASAPVIATVVGAENTYALPVHNSINSAAPIFSEPALNVPAESPFHMAIRARDIEGAKAMIAANKQVVNSLNTRGFSALHTLAYNNDVELGQVMFDADAVNVNATGPQGETALCIAGTEGHPAFLNLLLRHGADPTLKDNSGFTVVHKAAQSGHVLVLELLSQRGLDLNVLDNNKRSPMHWAAYQGKLPAVEWLMEHGADLKAKDVESCLPIHWASIKGACFRRRC
jgi:hypothetical protein